MKFQTTFICFLIFFTGAYSQESGVKKLVTDSTSISASFSVSIIDPSNKKSIGEFDSNRSLTPASVLKLVTSAAALELLGPEYTFKTVIGYSGIIDTKTGTLNGDIIIKGGGDPCLGSENFTDHYGDFISKWSAEIRSLGIKNINGRVITDDSFYDYEPVPSKWLWEDMGNYYGAGAYGLSIFDNYYSIYLKTSQPGTKPEIKDVVPALAEPEITNFLVSEGSLDNGYIFGSPYNNNVWISGTIPQNRDSFILKGSISDPPLLAAKILNDKLISSGVSVKGIPSTARITHYPAEYNFKVITETFSPTLSMIINVLDKESINLYAESLLKQLGLTFNKEGSTESGIRVLIEFLNSAGIKTEGNTIVDGSGLSPANHINADLLANLLFYMKTKGRYFEIFSKSFPESGKEGTLKNYFKDPLFTDRLKLKTGSMSGVRSFAGYVTAESGKEIIFVIIVNNYSGSSDRIISGIEEIVKEVIVNN